MTDLSFTCLRKPEDGGGIYKVEINSDGTGRIPLALIPADQRQRYLDGEPATLSLTFPVGEKPQVTMDLDKTKEDKRRSLVATIIPPDPFEDRE